MKIRTLKIHLSNCRFQAIYALTLLLLPLITACSSAKSAKKAPTPEQAETPTTPKQEPAQDSINVYYRTPQKDNMQDLSRMRLLYGVQPPRRTPE
jgi:hypothetical protein